MPDDINCLGPDFVRIVIGGQLPDLCGCRDISHSDDKKYISLSLPGHCLTGNSMNHYMLFHLLQVFIN